MKTKKARTSPPPPPANGPEEKPRPVSGQSFGAIAGRMFFRNRLAVGGLVVVFLIATVAIFAPLIASDKPLAIRTAYPERYDNSYFVFLDSHEFLMEADEDTPPERIREFIGYIAFNLDRMKVQLGFEEATRLAQLGQTYRDIARTHNFLERPDELEEAAAPILDEFEIENVELVPALYFPAIRSLRPLEISFMAFYLIFLAMLAVRKWWRWGFRGIALSAALAFVAAVAWGLAFPKFNDPTRYRPVIEAMKENGFYVLPPVFFGENENITADSRMAPSWALSEEARARARHYHALGTDTNGRDVLARMVWGSRISMSIGIVAVSIYVSIGIVLGSLAGYFRGWMDIVISRLIEVMICFPVMFLILIVLAFLRPNIFTIMVVLGVTGWTGIARLQRGEFLRLVDQDFVQAVRALGGSNLRIIFRHILPNAVGPILVSASFGIAGAILTETGLSFLGFGVPPPTASWGDLLYNGRNDIQGTWWLTIFPGAAIFITVTAFNLMGEGLRDAIDPRLRG